MLVSVSAVVRARACGRSRGFGGGDDDSHEPWPELAPRPQQALELAVCDHCATGHCLIAPRGPTHVGTPGWLKYRKGMSPRKAPQKLRNPAPNVSLHPWSGSPGGIHSSSVLKENVSPIATIDVCLEESESSFLVVNILKVFLVGILGIRTPHGPPLPASLFSLLLAPSLALVAPVGVGPVPVATSPALPASLPSTRCSIGCFCQLHLELGASTECTRGKPQIPHHPS